MGRKRKKQAAEKKKRRVTIEPLSREPSENGQTPHAYRIMDWLINAYHDHLEDAEIVIAYQMSDLKEDVDGTIGFGRVKRGNDLDRAYSEYDFVIIIPHGLWQNSDENRRHAIIDFHLSCCELTKDPHGEPVVDEKDRVVWRLRKPIKVFPENTRRYGFWQNEAIHDAIKAFKDRDRPLLPADREMGRGIDEPATGPLKDDPKPARKKRGKPKAESNGHAGNGEMTWRQLELNKIDGLAFDVVTAAANAGIKTLGGLEEFIESEGSIGLANIKGMGSERADSLMEAVKRYREAHPELFVESEEATA